MYMYKDQMDAEVYRLSMETINSFKDLARDPAQREKLAHDMTCLGGLVLLLDNEESNIVIASLETLLLLADSTESVRSYMKDFIGLIPQLDAIKTGSQVDQKVKDLGQKLHTFLTMNKAPSHRPLRDIGSVDPNSSGSTRRQPVTKKNSFFLGGKSKTIVLLIKGLNDRDDADCCKQLLLQVKGVISITFDFKRKRSILRTKAETQPESLVHAIHKSMTMSAQQVVRNDAGVESFLSFTTKPGDNKENVSIDYPSDEDDCHNFESKPMTRMGAPSSKPGDSSWLNLKRVSDFLTSSFYW